MTRKLTLLAIAFLIACPPVHAQYTSVPVLVPNGVGFQYSGNRLKVRGFLSTGVSVGYVPVGPGGIVFGPPLYAMPAYGVIERRVIIQQVVPGPVPQYALPEYDLSGIDLDVEPPDRLYPPGTAPVVAKRVVRPEELKKPAEVKAPPPVIVAPPAPLPAMKPPVDDLLVPRAGAVEESKRLVELGLRAFREQEYGLAAFRFRQATEVHPANAQAFFLLGQGLMAVGQFRDAVRAIHEGLRLQPDWPTSDFRPRLELYVADPEEWVEHRRRLEDAVKRQPKDAAFAFLRAYTAWFDGERAQAADWFMNARTLAPDPRWIDLFLKHAPPPAIAAR